MKPDMMPDQTQFITESPLYAEAEVADVSEKFLSEQELKQRQQKKIKRIVIGMAIFLFVAVSIFILIKSRSRIEKEEDSKAEEIELDEVIVGPFNQRLLELEKELELADPNQEELPFPPIDFEISLEE